MGNLVLLVLGALFSDLFGMGLDITIGKANISFIPATAATPLKATFLAVDENGVIRDIDGHMLYDETVASFLQDDSLPANDTTTVVLLNSSNDLMALRPLVNAILRTIRLAPTNKPVRLFVKARTDPAPRDQCRFNFFRRLAKSVLLGLARNG